jgi:hypothetical protein
MNILIKNHFQNGSWQNIWGGPFNFFSFQTFFGWLIQTHMCLTSLMLNMVSKFGLMQIYKQVWAIINLYYGSTF